MIGEISAAERPGGSPPGSCRLGDDLQLRQCTCTRDIAGASTRGSSPREGLHGVHSPTSISCGHSFSCTTAGNCNTWLASDKAWQGKLHFKCINGDCNVDVFQGQCAPFEILSGLSASRNACTWHTGLRARRQRQMQQQPHSCATVPFI